MTKTANGNPTNSTPHNPVWRIDQPEGSRGKTDRGATPRVTTDFGVIIFVFIAGVGVKLCRFLIWRGACATPRLVIAFAIFQHVSLSLIWSKEGVLGCTLIR